MDVIFHSIDGRSQLTMALEELTDPIQHVALSISHEGFAGHSNAAHFYRSDLVRFLDALRAFAQAHEGEVTLASMSPDETDLHIRAVDAARHVVLEATVGRYLPTGHRMSLNQVRVAFELDPSRWDEVLRALRAALDAPYTTLDALSRGDAFEA